jgi:high-affinity iron transporter
MCRKYAVIRYAGCTYLSIWSTYPWLASRLCITGDETGGKVIRLILTLGFSILGLSLWPIGSAYAASPQDDVAAANASVQRAAAAAQAGDIPTAQREYKTYENTWFDIEDGVRGASRDSYRAIEQRMADVNAALTRNPADKNTVVAALNALDAEQERFIAGQPPLESSPPTGSNGATAPAPTAATHGATISTLLDQLAATQAAVQAGNFDGATMQFKAFRESWLDVEGEVKTRSATDYRATEDDMTRVATALSEKSTAVTPMLDAMTRRLQPYATAGKYKPFDATIIVLREGMEALLVVVALLAFLKRSGSADKEGWIWVGAGIGVVASIALGVAINALLGKAFSGANREMLEGITGLLAAGMLLYVSYWLHSKSSLGAWQKYIGQQTTIALANGSLFGLAFLAFVAVFREGGETVLFFLGMVGNISSASLLLGIGIGALFLMVIGVLLIVVGVRIPMRPFFAVASVLTFYLCFKFLGTGIHSLQVADVLPARTTEYFPQSDTLGLFPTWQTTVPQLALLVIAATIAIRDSVKNHQLQRTNATAATTQHA